MNEDIGTAIVHASVKRIVTDFPFHAHLLARFDIVPTTTCTDTMGLLLNGLKFDLLFNPTFTARLSLEQCEALVLHVLNHAIFGHLTMSPKEFPDRLALAIAQEVTANEWVGGRRLPHNACMLEHFPQLPPDEDTVTRYHRLVRLPPPPKEHGHAEDSNHTDDDYVDDDGHPELRRVVDGDQDADGISPIDDHGWILNEDPEQPDESGRVQLALRADIISALEELRPKERQEVPHAISEAIEQLVQMPGTASDGEKTTLRSRRGSVAWVETLRRYIASLAERTPTYSRPSRRAPSLVGLVPATARLPARHRVVVAIDTSASMTVLLLETVAGELRRLAVLADIVVIECDTEIHATYRFQKSLNMVTGRGGTDLRPPFEAAVELRPDVLVYFTDGEGPAPERPPPFPVLWALTPTGTAPAAWGRVVWMEAT